MVSFLRWMALVMLSTLTLTACTPLSPPPAAASVGPQTMLPDAYDIGNPTLSELYVAPTGADTNPGTSATQPLRTLTEAWARVPLTPSTTGYRINLLPGVYPCEPGEPDACNNFFSDRTGVYAFPVIIRALNGPGSVTLRGGLNLRKVQYLYLLDLTLVGGGVLPTNSAGNNLLHLDASSHVLLRGLQVRGPDCPTDACNNLQEVLKVNQTDYLYVEGSEFGGAWHSTVDYFAVQYGHFLRNRLHTAGQWCMYVKGGSAYLRIAGNELFGCQLGFQAGQAANLAMMRSPWLHYEAYDIKFVNNLLHDLPGVGMSVAGGYNILLAYNTLYRVGTDTNTGYGLVQLVHGERNCTPTDELPDPAPNCRAFANLGGWGPTAYSESLPTIPNRNVLVANNLAYNPAPGRTLYTHFSLAGPIAPPAGFANVPNPVTTDDNLVFTGNLIWNGPPEHPLGVEAACLPSNPTCNETRIRADNTINTVEPRLASPDCGDYHLDADSLAVPNTTMPPSVPAWGPFTPVVPDGTLANQVTDDYLGFTRGATSPPGAYATRVLAYGCTKRFLPTVTR